MQAAIRATEYYLPTTVLTTGDLAAEFPEWPMEKIDKKTGISERHIAGPAECSSDLAFAAAQKLFSSGAVAPADVDGLLFCTQSPDYFLPATACLLQDRCTTSWRRWVTRHLHNDALQRMQQRATPAAMRLRRSTVEHPFATLKYRIFGHPRFLLRGVGGAQTEISLATMAYNLKRMLNVLGGKTLRAALAI